MIAKEIAMPRTGGSFRGLVTYLTSTRGKSERVGRVALTNCVSSDVASAILEVENGQARNVRACQTTYHLLLSFREDVASETLELIERRACEALGYGNHHRVSVVHHDTDHLHVHIAINRVNPNTHRVHWPSYSKLELDRLCVELERTHGLEPDRHWSAGREPVLQATEELRERLRSSACQELQQAQSWTDFTRVLQGQGVQAERRGNGLALVDGNGVRVRASTLSRDLSLKALERRLGPLELPRDSGIPRPRPRDDRTEAAASARRTLDWEHTSGRESLIGFVQRGCANALRAAKTWNELHAVAAHHGLRLAPRGNGLVFTASDGTAIKASSVARDLSLSALERRLGAFERPNNTAPLRTQYANQPRSAVDATSLFREFEQARATSLARRQEVAARYRERSVDDQAQVRGASKRRWAAVRLVAKGQVGWKLWAAYARTADKRDRERAKAKRRTRLRDELQRTAPTSWFGWLKHQASQGDAAALDVLRSRAAERFTSAVRDAVFSAGRPASAQTLPQRVDGITSAGTVVYRIAGGTIRDTGGRLHLSASTRSDVAAQELLRLASARYGAVLGVDGDSRFQEQLVRAAASARLPIAFADARLEQQRLELLERQTNEDQGIGRRGGPALATRQEQASFAGAAAGRSIRLRKPYADPRRKVAATKPSDRLRSVSALDVVRFESDRKMLLPPHALAHVDKRGADPDPAVRRSAPGRGVEERPRGKGQRR